MIPRPISHALRREGTRCEMSPALRQEGNVYRTHGEMSLPSARVMFIEPVARCSRPPPGG
jgi:hypothetical protein